MSRPNLTRWLMSRLNLIRWLMPRLSLTPPPRLTPHLSLTLQFTPRLKRLLLSHKFSEESWSKLRGMMGGPDYFVVRVAGGDRKRFGGIIEEPSLPIPSRYCWTEPR